MVGTSRETVSRFLTTLEKTKVISLIDNKIIIKDKKIELRYTVRSMFIYEKLANKVFQPSTLTELYLFFYSVILANDSSVDLTFDEFIEICDNDFSLFSQFAN